MHLDISSVISVSEINRDYVFWKAKYIIYLQFSHAFLSLTRRANVRNSILASFAIDVIKSEHELTRRAYICDLIMNSDIF